MNALIQEQAEEMQNPENPIAEFITTAAKLSKSLPTINTPLYISVNAAAKYAGVSDDTMRAWVNDPLHPLPYIKSGRKKLVRVSAIADYAMKKEYYT
jgi:excisionase family DNA binding protein